MARRRGAHARRGSDCLRGSSSPFQLTRVSITPVAPLPACSSRLLIPLPLRQAMLDTSITPDFITVDGGEGGTGAAPLEFSTYVGTPLVEGLTLVNRALIGAGLRDRVKIICAGKARFFFSSLLDLSLE